MIRVQDVFEWLDEHAPFRYAQSWDQCGLQVGDPKAVVERVMVALDVNSETLGEAENRRCECLVTHHPLIFRPLKALRVDDFPASLVVRALLSGVHVIAAHTNLDVARDGTNDRLGVLLALDDVAPLEVDDEWAREERYGGMGRIGSLPQPMRLGDLAARSAQVLGIDGLRMVGKPEREVRRVAICTGSGGSLLDLAIRSGVDVYLTGDLKYHEAQQALEAGLALIDVGHFASERLIVEPLVEYIEQRAARCGASLSVFAAQCEQDPFLFRGKGLN